MTIYQSENLGDALEYGWTIAEIFLHKSRDWLCMWYPDQNWQRLAQMCECYDNGGKNVFKIV